MANNDPQGNQPESNQGAPLGSRVPSGPVASSVPELQTVAQFAEWLEVQLVDLEKRFAGHQRRPSFLDRAQWRAPRHPR